MRVVIGFTLTELLVVIAIIGVLSSIAYPNYQSYMLKAQRADAKTELIKAQLKQTSLHILNPSYSNDKIELGLIDTDYYTFTVVSAGVATYLIQAVAIGIQTLDTECLTLTANQDSQYIPINCW
jgi:type IV pilus assembly protein PilE